MCIHNFLNPFSFSQKRVEHLFDLWYNIYVQSNRKFGMQISDYSPLIHKGVKPMDTMEVLTLILVIFAILAYLDNHYDHDSNKKK